METKSGRLTLKERKALLFVARGMSNKWIASHNNNSQKAVEAQISRACLKLHAVNRTQAVVKALQHGEISLHMINGDEQET